MQLWPPLYAVMHLVMTIHAQELAAMTAGQGLSMADYSMLNNAYISDEAIAGMIAATAIPAIAAAIVKGGDVGAQAIGGMVSPSREADKVASSMAGGNISMGNGSLNNQSADNLSMGQYSTQPSYQGGAPKLTNVGQSGSTTHEGHMTTVQSGGSQVIYDAATGQLSSANIAGVGLAGSTATASQGKSASNADFSGTGTASQTGTNTSLGDTLRAGLNKQQSAAFNRAMAIALNTSTGGGTQANTGVAGGSGSSTNQGTGGGSGLANKEDTTVASNVGVGASGSPGAGTPGKEGAPPPESPEDKKGKMAKLVHALGEVGGIFANKPINASSGLKIQTGQTYTEDAKKTIGQASQEEIKQAFSILSNAAHQVAATTNDSGVRQAANNTASTFDKAKTFDSKQVASLLHTEEAGNKRQEGTENKNGVNIDNSKALLDAGMKELYGQDFKYADLTPEKLAEFTQEWNRNPGFRDDVAMQVRNDMNHSGEPMLHNGLQPVKTQNDVSKTGQVNVDDLKNKGRGEISSQLTNNDNTVKKLLPFDPRSAPNLSPAMKVYAKTMENATTQEQQTASRVALESGIDIAATALYQDRQRGVSTVMGNAFLGGVGSASMTDYTTGLAAAANKDPELARGLATIALNQKHGQAPTTKEIQWVNDKANGAVQGAEGVMSSLNHKVEKAMNGATFNIFKADATQPTPR